MRRRGTPLVEAALSGWRPEQEPDWQGPVRESVIVCGDWQIRAEQHRSRYGSPSSYDVFCQHVGGDRVPPGANMRADPSAEMDRLERMLNWPRGAPRGFSWVPRSTEQTSETKEGATEK